MDAAGDWDLYAVVRGQCFSTPPPAITAGDADVDPFSSLSTFLLKEEFVVGDEEDPYNSFPDLAATENALHELEELCKPFFSKSQHQLLLSPERNSPSSSSAEPAVGEFEAVASRHDQPVVTASRQPHRSPSQTPRSKLRRKNQQKKVVCTVPADGLSSDMWAWRKYGQKPIKGSPYPRGYYRCSSSKGCLARKQVERSRADPATLIITYTAEHNHPIPTHRNSLAGSTRNKFPPPPSSSAPLDEDGEHHHHLPAISLPMTASMEPCKDEDGEEEAEGTVNSGCVELMGDQEDFTSMTVESDSTLAAVGASDSSSAFFDDDSGVAEYYFSTRWPANSNAVAGAGGG